MKKYIPSISLFVVTFSAVYLLCSFCIPGWRIKLEAEPWVFFIESLKSMLPIKALLAFGAGLVAGAIPFLIHRKK